MLRVRLGMQLDGAGSLHLPSRLGDVDLGPTGFLATLELHLGLTGVWPSQADRTVAYLSALRRAMPPARFYSQSLLVDELGTAAQLLHWRDTLFLGGWTGTGAPHFSKRLADLAHVETLADDSLRCSTGERLQRVANALASRAVPVECVRMVEPIAAYPAAWRRVLERLPTQLEPAGPSADPATALGKLQRAAVDLIEGRDVVSIPHRDDEGLRFVRAETRLLGGRWIAAELAAAPRLSLILAESEGEILDHLVAEAGLARHGFSTPSAFRPTLQVLPLALALLWDPLDIHAALKFLTHPVCPLPRHARSRLAKQFSRSPGLDRSSYEEVIEEIREQSGEKGDELSARIENWLFCARHSTAAGAPLAEVAARVEQLASYFARRLGVVEEHERPAFSAAQHQCEAVAKSLRQYLADGRTRIDPIQLDKVVRQATSVGTTNPQRFAEAGCAAFAEHPGAVIDAHDRVFWWRPGAPALPRALPWTRSELSQLEAAGVEMHSISGQRAQDAAHWIRPILAARQQLTLLLPDETSDPHPVWQIIRRLMPSAPVISLESLLTTTPPPARMASVEHRPLPVPRRWWKLDRPVRPRADAHFSFTALDKYLNNPFQWVLETVAGLRASNILTIPDVFTLSGNVAHRVIERLFARDDALQLSDAKLGDWTAACVDEVVRSIAAPFLLPGQSVALARLRTTVVRAVVDLRKQVRDAGAKTVEAERRMEGQFAGGTLVGSADLVLQFETGEHAVVDMKWAGGKKYPDKLANNRHLQLLIYAGLLEQQIERWPRYAYYLLSNAQLLAQDREVFADARVCSPGERVALPELWTRFERTFGWRKAQLEAGLIEVALEGIEPDENSLPPQDGFALETLSTAYNPFVNLAGTGDR